MGRTNTNGNGLLGERKSKIAGNNQLVFKTLDQATVLLNGAHPLIHSDRGFQYTFKGFKYKVDAAEMTQSLSRVARCIYSGPMESFLGTLKCEKYYYINIRHLRNLLPR